MKKLKHLAIILDGNGRWAKNQAKERTFGHKKGMDKIFQTIILAKEYGIKYLTLFCFSTENWNRPKKEVDYLMKFPGEVFNEKETKKYIENEIKVNWIGRRTKIPSKTRKALENIEEKTKELMGIEVNIAVDYGSKEEIETAIVKTVSEMQKVCQPISEIKFEMLYNNLYTKNAPPVDLLIRTGGEQRLSNFMLLQLSYAELYFTKTYWPDFGRAEMKEAIDDYNNRNRRFGKIEV